MKLGGLIQVVEFSKAQSTSTRLQDFYIFILVLFVAVVSDRIFRYVALGRDG